MLLYLQVLKSAQVHINLKKRSTEQKRLSCKTLFFWNGRRIISEKQNYYTLIKNLSKRSRHFKMRSSSDDTLQVNRTKTGWFKGTLKIAQYIIYLKKHNEIHSEMLK